MTTRRTIENILLLFQQRSPQFWWILRMRLAAAQTFTKLVLSMYNPIKVWGHGGPVKDIYVVSLKTAVSILQCVRAHCPDEKLMCCLVSAAVSMMPA